MLDIRDRRKLYSHMFMGKNLWDKHVSQDFGITKWELLTCFSQSKLVYSSNSFIQDLLEAWCAWGNGRVTIHPLEEILSPLRLKRSSSPWIPKKRCESPSFSKGNIILSDCSVLSCAEHYSHTRKRGRDPEPKEFPGWNDLEIPESS